MKEQNLQSLCQRRYAGVMSRPVPIAIGIKVEIKEGRRERDYYSITS
jgi:hypothetical protein